jgi:hypothetical protein
VTSDVAALVVGGAVLVLLVGLLVLVVAILRAGPNEKRGTRDDG